jgi:Domain of unknown function (DUF4386)
MKTLIRDPHQARDTQDVQRVERVEVSTVETSGVSASPNTLARIGGLMYVMLCATAFFAVYVNSRIVKSGNATATADNIRKSTTLFRYGFMGDLMQATFFLFTAMALYVLLKHVNRLVAAAMMTIVAISVAIQSLNMLNTYTAMMIATDKGYTGAFGKPGSDALTMLFTDMQANGFFIAQVFFGLWLLPLGYLVIKSRYVPKVFGIVLIAGCVNMLVELFAHFLSPGFEDTIKPVITVVGTVAEIPFFLWLLVRGVRTQH